MPFVTRFAPSPTGPLHLGHAYSALLAHDMARAAGGQFLLRIEDIDRTRARPAWEDQIYDDLRWLGITWDAEPLRQSDRLPAYRAALEGLWERGLLYACGCTRRDIQSALSAPQEGVEPAFGPDGLIYPGTCRDKPRPEKMPEGAALRLDMTRAVAALDTAAIRYEETGETPQTVTVSAQDMTSIVGDIILSRRDFFGSYHLSVVLDDAHQGITHVVRGQDIAEATQIHILLQQLLALPTPVYHHHRLIRDPKGKRLAKRDDARAIAKYRDDGASPADIRRMVGL
ncbi:tRNA glutamyl-Q(34) synthetase GluQRS [Phaeobacter sp. CNT1-3]|nr:tRNA glutamyl-Q(34) synthetase GluQRS [Phaeobacter sp. CNT1-3]